MEGRAVEGFLKKLQVNKMCEQLSELKIDMLATLITVYFCQNNAS